MKFKSLVIFLILIILTSCATNRNMEYLTSDDCIIVIPTSANKVDGVANARTYHIHITDIEKGRVVPKNQNGYMIIKIRNENSKIEHVTSQVSGNKFRGSSSWEELGLSLPYEPGKVIITDFQIIQELKKIEEDQYSSIIKTEEFSEEDKVKLMEKIRGIKKLSSWFQG